MPEQPGIPPGVPPSTRLEQMTAPVPPGGPGVGDPVGTLTGQPSPKALPPGSYGSPWFTDGPGCCGPMGRNGQIAYELYANTGPSLVFGSGKFTDVLHAGWSVGGGARTLFFNTPHDAAWVLDLGLNYTYNRGSSSNLLDVFVRQPALQGANGQAIAQPDVLTTSRIRGLSRTSFNFALGRDWFLWGPGNPGGEPGWNLRVGGLVGGQWGTAHVDIVPDADATLYARRQKVFHGVFLDAHAYLDVPLGGWIWTNGLNVQWGYQWMDIVPPLKGDMQFVNFLLTTGFRF